MQKKARALDWFRHIGRALAKPTTDVNEHQAEIMAQSFANQHYRKSTRFNEWAVANIMLFYRDAIAHNEILRKAPVSSVCYRGRVNSGFPYIYGELKVKNLGYAKSYQIDGRKIYGITLQRFIAGKWEDVKVESKSYAEQAIAND